MRRSPVQVCRNSRDDDLPADEIPCDLTEAQCRVSSSWQQTQILHSRDCCLGVREIGPQKHHPLVSPEMIFLATEKLKTLLQEESAIPDSPPQSVRLLQSSLRRLRLKEIKIRLGSKG